jgi:hypothetical protein
MRKHITEVELSAFVDGESRKKQSIKAHLSGCQTCRDTVERIAAVSRALGKLPAPDVHPAFAQRILAQLGEETAPRYARSMPWGLTLAGVAAMGLLVASVLLPSAMNSGTTPAQVALIDTDASASSLELRDEASLLAEFDRVFSDDSDAFTNVMLQAYTTDPVPDDLDDDFVVLALADDDVLNTVSDEWAVANDLRSVVNSMNASETALFKQLLAESADTESAGSASHKG